MHDQLSRDLLALSIRADRITSREEIEFGHYPHADRSLDDYRFVIADFDEIVRKLISNNKNPIQIYDVGCGTGRAMAELEEKYGGKVSCSGCTLNRFPPIEGHKFLPREKIAIKHARNLGLPPESFHLILAVGSLARTEELFLSGQEIFKLIKPGGYFIVVDTFTEVNEDFNRLLINADLQGLEVNGPDHSSAFSNTVYFYKPLK